jgi:hydrogenase-4 membrane subunit HyfE
MYSASLGDVPGAGALASTAPTTSTQNHNVAANAGGDRSALHFAVGVVVLGLLVLLVGRGYLRNARIA